MKKIFFHFLFIGLFVSTMAYAQTKLTAPQIVTYKKIDTTALTLEVYNPLRFDAKKSYPVIVFFFGGGWSTGTTAQFEPHARYLNSRGITAILVNYRVKQRQGTSPIESLKDAKSAIRYIRKNAGQLHIEADKIIAAGGSAGGQLAAAVAYTSDINEATDDLSISTRPNALVLFNPAVDNGPGGAAYELVATQYKSFSPLHNIQKGLPPAIFFLGTKDDITPVETAQYYKKANEKAGNRVDLFLYEGQPHGFFNLKKSPEYYTKTLRETDIFLTSLGYLTGEPTISLEKVQGPK